MSNKPTERVAHDGQHPRLRGMATLLLAALGTFVLGGCVTLSSSELEPFSALPDEGRVMKRPRITWEVRDDASQYCMTAMGLGDKAFLTPPLACSFWNVRSNECLVVTSRKTSHTILGHEIRHCFEGHFHK